MKRSEVSFFLIASLFIFCDCSLPIDEEDSSEETDLTSQLAWSGETDKFVINPKKGVHLDDPQASGGTAYLTFPSTALLDTSWEFGVQLSFNPSANNHARFYLASSSTTLSGDLDGYYVQIGGTKDNLALYRQQGDRATLLLSGRELMKKNNSPKFYAKVECDCNGYWTLWSRLESEAGYVKEGQVKDCKIDSSICCGLFCVYTQSRSNGFTFHHITQGHNVETVTDPGENPEPPTDPNISELPDDVRGLLLLNEVMYYPESSGAEYVEIFNPTEKDIILPAIYLYKMYENGEVYNTTVLQPEDTARLLSIPSKGYLCFTKSVALISKKHKVAEKNLIEIAKFPSLNNSGGYLALSSSQEPGKGHTFDTCCFRDEMHSQSETIGISLEKKSPEKTSVIANWHSSQNPTGGTPGIINSGIK